jgi:hypothetical protein
MKTQSSAIFVSDSENKKLRGERRVDCTYVSIEKSCPSSCKLKDSGCYAQVGNVAIHLRKLDKTAHKKTALDVARDEARAIDESYGGGPVPKDRILRLHVSGDCRTKRSAQILAAAIRRWKRRGGGNVWTYTHSWRTIPRDAWGDISVFASIEDPRDASNARARGYASAVIVPKHEGEKLHSLPNTSTEFVPCPAQTKDIPCSDCQLCCQDEFLRKMNRGISFAAHGPVNKVKRHLPVLSISEGKC